ncbi:glycoside hydrolase family 127 protein, partial [Clostridium perfringens]
RGPLVYCLESVDHGAPVSSLSLAGDPKLHSRFAPDFLGGAGVIEGDGWLEESNDWGDELYRSSPKKRRPAALKAIPYYLWGNRGENEMAIWVRELPHTV